MYNLPEYYNGIPEFDELEDKLLKIEKESFDNLEHLKREVFIISSNEEGLDIWSKTLGTSKTKLDILTKLRGSKTITKLNLAYIVKDILNQDTLVEVTEQNEIYRVLIGVHDTNENLDGIQEKLRKELKLIIPSHIELLIYFNGLIWIKYDAYDKNWNEWDRLDLTWNEFERYNESV